MSSVLREIAVGGSGAGGEGSSSSGSVQERKKEAMLKRLQARNAQRKSEIEQRRALVGGETNEAQTNAFWVKFRELDAAAAEWVFLCWALHTSPCCRSAAFA